MCSADTFPQIARRAGVRSNREIAPGIFELVIDRRVSGVSPVIPAPVAGQFFMLRARPSGVLLGRPISVYLFDDDTVTFLILRKGKGSAELCALRENDGVDLVGPIGNSFIPPDELASSGLLSFLPGAANAPLRIAIIGGGIGVAPVAGFALGLGERTFDFYASFRSAPYGLEGLARHASRVIITTEDGSAGVKGMLPAVFDPSKYDLVYACGPTPMLRYIQQACSGPLVFLSLEEHMACGAGACLGCTVRTVNGNRRCCVDGPVFNAAEVIL